MSSVVNLVLGVAMLLLGRRLFWLFVGVAGFILGIRLAPQLFGGQPDWVLLLIALVFGIVGALLAILLQWVAIAVAGFLLGGFALVSLATLLNFNPGQYEWLVYIIGGIFGAIVILALFDPALIILSSLAGAGLIVQVLNFSAQIELVLFVILTAVGIGVQASLLNSSPPAPVTYRRRRVIRRS